MKLLVTTFAILLFFIPTQVVAQTATIPDPAKDLEITHIRVGQGDSTLIEGPLIDGKRITVLFDAGDRVNRDKGSGKSRDAGNIIRAILKSKGIKEIDYVITSHYDADHIGGIVYGRYHGRSFVLGYNDRPGINDGDANNGWVDGYKCWRPNTQKLGQQNGRGADIKVKHWVDRGNELIPLKNAGVLKYLEMTSAIGTRVTLSTQDDIDNYSINLGDDAKMTLLAGNGFIRKADTPVKVRTENERSLSFWVNYGNFDYLISGDLIGREHGNEKARVEDAVGRVLAKELNKVGRGEEGIDVLHVNHHGANNGSEKEFLKSIKPNVAIISTGNGNGHHHPHNETLERLYDAGVDRIIQTSWGTTRNYNQGFFARVMKNKKDVYDDIRGIHSIFQADVTVTANKKKYTIGTSRTFLHDAIKHETKPTPKTNCDPKPSGLELEWRRKLNL